MKFFHALALVFFSTCVLSACSLSDDDEGENLSLLSPAAGGPLLPLPDEIAVHDPDDGLFMDSVTSWLHSQKASSNSQYEFTRVDLDGDGRRDGIVLLQRPHQEWCMEYGCTMYIFKAHDEGFSYLSEISPIRGPLVVSEARTNGWRDIIANVSGRSADAKNVALKFDGASYPAQPAMQPAVMMNVSDSAGIKIFP